MSNGNGHRELIRDSDEVGVTSVSIDIPLRKTTAATTLSPTPPTPRSVSPPPPPPVEENEESFVSEEEEDDDEMRTMDLFSSTGEGSGDGDFIDMEAIEVGAEEDPSEEVIPEGEGEEEKCKDIVYAYKKANQILEEIVVGLKRCEIGEVSETRALLNLREEAQMDVDDMANFIVSMNHSIAKELLAQLDSFVSAGSDGISEDRLRYVSYNMFGKQIERKELEVETANEERCIMGLTNERGKRITKCTHCEHVSSKKFELKELKVRQAKCTKQMFDNYESTRNRLESLIDHTRQESTDYRKRFYMKLFAKKFNGVCVKEFPVDLTDESAQDMPLNTFGKMMTTIANANAVCLDVSNTAIEITPKLWETLAIDKWIESKRMSGFSLGEGSEKDLDEFFKRSKEVFSNVEELKTLRDSYPMRRFDLPSMLRCALSGISIFPGDRVLVCRLFVSFKDNPALADIDFAKNETLVLDQHTCCFFIHADLDAFTFNSEPFGYIEGDEGDEEVEIDYAEDAYDDSAEFAREAEALMEDLKEINRNKTKGKVIIDSMDDRARRKAQRNKRRSTITVSLSESEEEEEEEPLTPPPAPRKSKKRKSPPPSTPVEDSMGGIKEFLEGLGYSRLIEKFRGGPAEMVEELPYLEDEDFRAMGLDHIKTRRLKRRIEEAKLDG
jgi:hypothetical protein